MGDAFLGVHPRWQAAFLAAGVLFLLALAPATVAAGAPGEGDPADPRGPLVDHGPIWIHSDAGFTEANGVVDGVGSAADPFVIEGWRIAPAGGTAGIYVRDTTKHFVIRRSDVVGPGGDGAASVGIQLHNVAHARIQDVSVSGWSDGIDLRQGRDVWIQRASLGAARSVLSAAATSGLTLEHSRLEGPRDAHLLDVDSSQGIRVHNNTLAGGSLGIRLHRSERASLEGNEVTMTGAHERPRPVGVRVALGSSDVDVSFNRLQGMDTGFEVQDVERVRLESNQVLQPASFGIHLLETAHASTLSNNTITDAGVRGISAAGEDAGYARAGSDEVASFEGLRIVNNTVLRSREEGIAIYGDDNLLAGNRVLDSGGQGIRLAGSSNTVSGNELRGGTSSIDLFYGSGNTVRENQCADNEVSYIRTHVPVDRNTFEGNDCEVEYVTGIPAPAAVAMLLALAGAFVAHGVRRRSASATESNPF